MRCGLFTIFGLYIALIAPTHASWLTKFSPRLREVIERKTEVESKLQALGTPPAGQAFPNVGFMHSEKVTPEDGPRWVQVDLGTSCSMDHISLFPVKNDDYGAGQGDSAYEFPRRFRVDVSDDFTFQTFTTVFAQNDTDFPNPGIAPVTFATNGITARYARVTSVKPQTFALAELMILQRNRNIALGCQVTSSGELAVHPRWSVGNLVDGKTPLGPPIVQDFLDYDGLYAGPSEGDKPVFLGVDLGQEVQIEEVRIHPVHARFNQNTPGYGFPNRFRVELAGDAEFRNPIILYDSSSENFPNPGSNVLTFVAGQKARCVRVLLFEGGGAIDRRRFGLSEIEVYSHGVNLARKVKVLASVDPAPKTGSWPKSLLNDGYTSFGRLLELPVWLNEWNQRRELHQELENLGAEYPVLVTTATRRAQWLGFATLVIMISTIGYFMWRSRRLRQSELRQFRRKLTQDLHDEIGSNLAAIGVFCEAAAEDAAPGEENYWRRVHQIARETTDAMRETLWIAGGNEMGVDLLKHLQLAATRMLTGRKFEWISLVDSLPPDWSGDARREVFLFFKEALANVVRHSGSDAVDLAARVTDGWFELEIRDNGRGFSPGTIRNGIGLYSLKERGQRLGGTVQIETAPGKGTRVVLRVRITS